MGDETLKDMVMAALHSAGGVEYLKEQAETNPDAFMALLRCVLQPAGRLDLREATLSECSIFTDGRTRP